MSESTFTKIASSYDKKGIVQKSASGKLFELLGVKEDEDVLDVGCGTGSLTSKIRAITAGRVVGIDPSEGMIEKARNAYKDSGVTFLQSCAEDVEYENRFDVIFCNSAFQWLKNTEPALARLHKALRPGGRIGVQAPATSLYQPNIIKATEQISVEPETKDTFARFESPWVFFETADEYTRLFESAGYKVACSRLETTSSTHTPREAFGIFESGAAAGYLNSAHYKAPVDDSYIENFKKIVMKSFVAQAGPEGLLNFAFKRIYLLAFRE